MNNPTLKFQSHDVKISNPTCARTSHQPINDFILSRWSVWEVGLGSRKYFGKNKFITSFIFTLFTSF